MRNAEVQNNIQNRIGSCYSDLQYYFDKEKKIITKQWAKRTEQIDRVIKATMNL